MTKLDVKLGVEGRAAVHVPREARNPPRRWVMAVQWASADMSLLPLATGMLGPHSGLDLRTSIAVAVGGTVIGSMVTAWLATLGQDLPIRSGFEKLTVSSGPKTGLRQISIARYSFGHFFSPVVALLAVVAQLSGTAVGCITGGLALAAVSDGYIPVAVGIVLLAFAGLAVSFFGLHAVLRLEEYAWIVAFSLFIAMYAEVAQLADLDRPSQVDGGRLTGKAMTYMAIVYGSATSWAPVIADYYVHYPPTINPWTVWAVTFIGLAVPTLTVEILGCCIGSTIKINSEWAKASEAGLGYLVDTILYPKPFARFALVLFVLGTGTCFPVYPLHSRRICTNLSNIVSMNAIGLYSTSLALTQLPAPLSRLPRSMYTLLACAAVLILGLAGRDRLLLILSDFFPLVGYWGSVFIVVLAAEHCLFRRSNISEYGDLDVCDRQDAVPVGIAGALAFVGGAVGGCLGVVQTRWIGPVARAVSGGEGGGDVGWLLAGAFAAIVYVPVRWLERKWYGH